MTADFLPFIRTVKEIGLDFQGHEAIADFLFLASEVWPVFSQPAPEAVLPVPAPRLPEPPARRSEVNLPPDKGSDSPYLRMPEPDDRPIFPVSGPRTTVGARASRIDVPDPPALANPLLISRALRPLSRRIRSVRFLELDEEATAEQTARWQQVSLVFRPAQERWFDLVMVVEDTVSMAVWKKTLDELERLFGTHGAFRDVRRVQLRASADAVGIVMRDGGLSGPGSLIDPAGRRLILLFTHGVGPGWRSERLNRALFSWCSHQVVAIVQMLPPHQWEQTSLGEPEGLARSPRPGLPNSGWLSVRPYIEELLHPGGAPVPVISPDRGGLGNLAAGVMSQGSSSLAAFQTSASASTGPESSEKGTALDENRPKKRLAPEALVARFRMHATGPAMSLAIALAASPLTLPVMRLVQQTVCKPDESGQVHIAELLLSGLMYRVRSNEDPEADLFDFVDGVRPVLSKSLPLEERLAVRQKVFAYIRKNPDAARVFPGLVPNADGAEFIPFWASPFAGDYKDFQRENLLAPNAATGPLAEIGSWIQSIGSTNYRPLLIVEGADRSGLPVRGLFKKVPPPRISVWVDWAEQSPRFDEWAIALAIAGAAGWSTHDVPTYAFPTEAEPTEEVPSPVRSFSLRHLSDSFAWLEPKIRASHAPLLIALKYAPDLAPDFDRGPQRGHFLTGLMGIASAEPALMSLALIDFPLDEIPVEDAQSARVVVLKPPSSDADVARLRLLQRNHPPHWVGAHYWKLHNARTYEIAEEYCRLILCLDSEEWSARSFLTHLLGEHMGRVLEAETMLREGIALRESEPNMHFNLAMLLVKLGRNEEALVEFDIAGSLVRGKDRSQVLSRRSSLLLKMGRDEEAISVFNDAFEANPDVDSANHFAWALYQQNVRLDLAEEVALRGYKLDPSDVNMVQTLAAIFVRRGKWAEAVPVMEAYFKGADIQDVKTRWNEDALLFCDAFRIGRAVDLAELVMRAAPVDPVWSTIATALRMAVQQGGESVPSNELGGPVQELVKQFTGEVTDLRFPGSPVAAEEDH